MSLGRTQDFSLEPTRAGVDKALDVLQYEVDEGFRSAAIKDAFGHWENAPPGFRYKQRDLINLVGERGDKTELTALAEMLHRHHNALVGTDIDLILDWLSRTPSNAYRTLWYLNMAICRNDERWKFENVVGPIEFCLLLLDKPVDANYLYEFCKWLWDDPKHASYLFSRWLLNGQSKLCDFLSGIFQDQFVERLVDIQKGDLPTGTDDQNFLAEKCVGYLFWSQEVVVASILLSIVRNGTSKARVYAETLLFDPMLLSYSENLRRYLEDQRGNKSKRISECIERLLNEHDKYLADIDETRDVVELQPTIHQRHAVARKNRKSIRDVQTAAKKQLVFDSLVNRRTLLYGSKSLSIIRGMDGKLHPQINELTVHSYNIKVPCLLAVDLVGIIKLLDIFKAKKRDQQ